MSYKVWRISYAGAPRDHHAIFVETEKDQSGQIFQIIGDIQSGMRYETKQAKKPENSASFQAKIFLGSVSTSKALQRPKKNQPPSASSTVPRMNGRSDRHAASTWHPLVVLGIPLIHCLIRARETTSSKRTVPIHPTFG
jgi:hypothetical protein